MAYNPKPIDTSQILLNAALTELTERLAENVHDTWSQRRLAEGWRYGPSRNDASKEHPNLVPYDQLPEHEREYDRKTALETIRMLLSLGYQIEAPGSKPDAATHPSMRAREELERLSSLLSKGARLQELVAIWSGRDSDAWAGSEALFRLLGEGVLKIGEPLFAYDVAKQGLEHFPSSVRLRQLLGLALARSGASEAATAILTQLYNEGHEDEETLGLLARSYKDMAEAAVGSEKKLYLQRAKDFYVKAYEKTNGYWSGINAATLAVLLGERQYASKLAREARMLCNEELKRLKKTSRDPYWVLATLGEAALILEEWAEAEECYSQAAEVARKRYGDLHTSRRNARLLMAHLNAHSDRIEACFHLPAVVVFAGHMVDQPGRRVPRFQADLEPKIYAAIQERLHKLDAGFGYSSAAFGSDILFCEAMLERDGEIHIVLPYEKSHFIEASVDRAPGWRTRFERVLERAADVVVASGHRIDGDGILYEYANRILYGLARGRAEQLETGLAPLAVWDGEPDDGPGGTASAIELWRAAGAEIEIIDVAGIPRISRPEAAPRGQSVEQIDIESAPAHSNQDFAPEIRALLFADAVGFGKLSETEVPLFVRHFLGLVGKLVQEFSPAPLMKNTWGDGLYFVFPDVRSAGRFALELRDRVKATRWGEQGLRDLELRIGLHAGPVYGCIDPVTGLRNYIGAHVSRAARIEPITPPGNVYASQSFAALAAAEKSLEFKCDYVGQTSLAKEYGNFPTYVVLRRCAASSGNSHASTLE
jgi:class 3 adenylate cyclase/tetratricopeptide (TPR) repeat protein